MWVLGNHESETPDISSGFVIYKLRPWAGNASEKNYTDPACFTGKVKCENVDESTLQWITNLWFHKCLPTACYVLAVFKAQGYSACQRQMRPQHLQAGIVVQKIYHEPGSQDKGLCHRLNAARGQEWGERPTVCPWEEGGLFSRPGSGKLFWGANIRIDTWKNRNRKKKRKRTGRRASISSAGASKCEDLEERKFCRKE